MDQISDVSSPTVRRISLSGEIDLATAHRLEAVIAAIDATPVELDMSNVDFVDSTGLKVLIGARRTRPDLQVVNPSRALRRLLEVTGTTHLVLGASA